MAFGKKKDKQGEARRYMAAFFISLYFLSSALSCLTAAVPGYAASQGHTASKVALSGFLVSEYSKYNTISRVKFELGPAQPSPYAVAHRAALFPYQTGDWGTIETGQKYGINGNLDLYGPELLTNEDKGIEPAQNAAGPMTEGVSRVAKDKLAALANTGQPQSMQAQKTEPAAQQHVQPRANSGEAQAQQAEPQPKAKPQPQKFPVRLFSTVDFRSTLKDMPKWERVLHAERRQPSFTEEGLRCASEKTAGRWTELKRRLQGQPLMEQVKAVNTFFNKWPYRSDKAIWGVEDYWATPCEFVTRSGDCEDYAIAKYFALRNLGVSPDIMRIAAVKDTIRGIGHAVLVVYNGNEAYVLDNLSNLVLSHKRLKHYRPLFTVNENYLWRHVKPIAGPDSK